MGISSVVDDTFSHPAFFRRRWSYRHRGAAPVPRKWSPRDGDIVNLPLDIVDDVVDDVVDVVGAVRVAQIVTVSQSMMMLERESKTRPEGRRRASSLEKNDRDRLDKNNAIVTIEYEDEFSSADVVPVENPAFRQ